MVAFFLLYFELTNHKFLKKSIFKIFMQCRYRLYGPKIIQLIIPYGMQEGVYMVVLGLVGPLLEVEVLL